MLNLILFSRSKGKILNLQCNDWSQVCISLLVILMIMGLLTGVSYYAGTQHSDSHIMAKWKFDLTEREQELASIKDQHRLHLDALTQRTALLQAQLNRIDALGAKLVSMADLEDGEFDFGSPPGIGGPDLSAGSSNAVAESLEDSLEQLSLSSSDREKQLQVLDHLLLSNTLHEKILPQGRPVKQGWVSSGYGIRTNPFSGQIEFHKGIDFAAKSGDKVIAVADGIVTSSAYQSGYGNLIEIDHGDGYSTRYGHNNKILVHPGEVVTRGEAIALMGSTGRSTGPHVHFEVMQNGKQINPDEFIRAAR